MNGEKIKGFCPIVNKNCTILILGSIPSKISRKNNFFYSNPTNRFWKILTAIFNEDFVTASNDEKTRLLLKNGIALSDVYESCQMKKEGSSLDSNIVNYKFNDINSVISGTDIKKVFITSKKAYDDFTKNFKDFSLPVVYLPSPSSANRSEYKTDDDLINAWKKLLKQ